MQNLDKSLFNPYVSHIYVEKKALSHLNTMKILNYFSKSRIIEINHYKDVFSRSHQNYVLQKKSFKLILAVKEDNLIYRGSQVCHDFGNNNFYYTSTMMNCIYDCEYCYLQGMYTSSNVVIFVNIEDIFKQVERLLKKQSIYLCISYDTDILAFENILGYGRKWIDFATNHNNLKIELRTKSANFKAIEDIEAKKNIILAWTLSPDKIIREYENKTPLLKERIISAKKAISKGWNVRLCFDPILYVRDWEYHYKNLVENTFKELPKEKIYDVSIGVFRVSKDYLKRMRKKRNNSAIINYPFETVNGVCTYNNKLSKHMCSYVYNIVRKYISEDIIYSGIDNI